jgi:hypothetical protein
METRLEIDKMRIAHYINVQGKNEVDAKKAISEYKKENSHPDSDIIEYFIPILYGDSRIEILK